LGDQTKGREMGGCWVHDLGDQTKGSEMGGCWVHVVRRLKRVVANVDCVITARH